VTPYYQDDSCTIYHADCRDILPQLEPVDLVLTDPPYGIGEDGGDKKRRRDYEPLVVHEKFNWDQDRPNREIFQMIFACSKHQAIFGGNYFTDYLPPSMGWIYWDKRMGGDFSDGELIFTSQKKALRRFDVSPFENLRGGHDRQHPTQKPLSLMKYIILRFENAQTILDPFMGSGTTLVAAKNLDRKAIGIEREEKYCEIAVKRLSQEVLSL